MTKIEWFDEEVGDGPYKWRTCGHRIDITDSPHRDALIRNADRERAMMVAALRTSIFLDDETNV